MAAADSTLDMTLRDLQRVLHEELRRLPDKYRLPLMLCYLEGRSQEDAARQLGWSKGAFRGRLDRGREHLRRRLASRGIALSAMVCAAAVTPRMVAEGYVQSAIQAAHGVTSAKVSVLAEGVIWAMFTSKINVAMAVVLAAGLIVAAAALTQQVTAGHEPVKMPPAPAAKSPTADAKPPIADNADSTTYSGRVLGPDGKPVADAKLYVTTLGGGYYRHPSPADENATSGADGRFQFAVSKAKFEERWGVKLVASAATYGVGWVEVRAGTKKDDVTIQLVKDDFPITGQIVDLEGKAIPNATLTVWQIHAAGDDIEAWVQDAMNKKGLVLELERKYFPDYTIAPCPKVTTDADGKFRLTGIGRNRLVHAILEGPTIASQHVSIVTRPGKPIDVLSHKSDREYADKDLSRFTTYFGADFRHAAAPCQPVVGIVSDVDTKKPLASVIVVGYSQRTGPSSSRRLDVVIQATTDADGRYRLVGLPAGKGYSIAVIPGKDQPYVARHLDVPDGVGVNEAKVDVDLRRGGWIEGKITDKVTGKPIKGSVEYFSMYDNPNLRDFPGYDGTILMNGPTLHVSANEDGSFRVVGLPGPGLIGVYYQRSPYLRADQRDDEFGTKERSLRTAPYWLGFTSNFNAIAKVDPAKGAESAKRDVTIDPGWTFKATVLGPDGKPMIGAQSFNLNMSHTWDRVPMKTAEFTGGFNSVHPYDIVVRKLEKGLVGVAKPPKQNGGAVAVEMQAGAIATGRLVDSAGKPLAGVELDLWFRPKEWRIWNDYLPFHIKTDGEGRFRIDGLQPGYDYRLRDEHGEILFGDGLRSEDMKDLGDVRLQKSNAKE
jgi:protocatechuate 3,4-dioxygenase beta subunit